jgi:alpha-tubulin suppressor-like RCC1 family protein
MDGAQHEQPALNRPGSARHPSLALLGDSPNLLRARRRSRRRPHLGLIVLVGALTTFVGAFASPQPGESAVAAAPTATGQTLYSWGYFGSHGVLGVSRDSPTAVIGIPGQITQIATSNSDTYLLTASGTVWAFGANQYGELGIGTISTPKSFLKPVQVHFPSGIKIAQLVNPMPYDTAIAIDTTGHAWGWGYNGGSDLCLGSASLVTAPDQLPFSNVSLAAGAGHHASYDSNNTLYACGDNQFGQLGSGTTKNAKRPVAVKGLPAGRISVVESSYGSSGVLFAAGAYYNWGLNNFSQLGNESTVNSAVPVLVGLPQTVTQVFQGGSSTEDGQTLAVLADGSIWGWGADGYGQLCDGAATNSVATPTPITPPTGVTWTQVFTGGKSSYALDSNTNLWVCGNNQQGQLGNGTKNKGPNPNPMKVLSGVTMFSSTQSNLAAVVGS